jgi:DNA-directed RNA polymerase specialized sigma24 family protein
MTRPFRIAAVVHSRPKGCARTIAGMTDSARAELLRDALLSLSTDHRIAVVRAYYLGQTVADIAAREGIAEGTVKSRLHYTLQSLRTELQERGASTVA